jgi:hypothetical protein
MPNGIFEPTSKNRVLDYATSSRMQFSRDEWEKRKKNPGQLAYNPHLKALCGNVAFLVEKCREGDSVIYVGGSVSSYICLLANMFPSIKFNLFDHNISNHLKKTQEEDAVPSNLQLHNEVFSDLVSLLCLSSLHCKPHTQ